MALGSQGLSSLHANMISCQDSPVAHLNFFLNIKILTVIVLRGITIWVHYGPLRRKKTLMGSDQQVTAKIEHRKNYICSPFGVFSVWLKAMSRNNLCLHLTCYHYVHSPSLLKPAYLAPWGLYVLVCFEKKSKLVTLVEHDWCFYVNLDLTERAISALGKSFWSCCVWLEHHSRRERYCQRPVWEMARSGS